MLTDWASAGEWLPPNAIPLGAKAGLPAGLNFFPGDDGDIGTATETGGAIFDCFCGESGIATGAGAAVFGGVGAEGDALQDSGPRCEGAPRVPSSSRSGVEPGLERFGCF